MLLDKPNRRHFTAAARAAAAEARRRKREQALPREAPEVFVVRRPEAHLQFVWEIRRFGAVTIGRGDVGYASPRAARSAGLEVLPRFMEAP